MNILDMENSTFYHFSTMEMSCYSNSITVRLHPPYFHLSKLKC